MTTAQVEAFFDESTHTVSYVVTADDGAAAVVIDPVLDYDPISGRTSTDSAERICRYVAERALTVVWILETHVHADHLSAAQYLKTTLGGRIGIGRGVTRVQATFSELFNLSDMPVDGCQFDRLLDDGDEISAGALNIRVMHTPGHTPACVSYLIGDAAFVGDTLFMPDFGTARTDFPGGSAAMLYASIQRLLSLPEKTRLYMCHDYKAPGRDVFRWESSVAEQRANNVHARSGVSAGEFIAFRESRDQELTAPALILPSLQANIRAGALPDPESNGIRYFKIPIDAL